MRSVLVATALLAACGQAKPERIERARPVTVLTLAETEPAIRAQLTGSAEPYREEQIGFEVGGRLEFVFDVGWEAEGTAYDERGEIESKGELIAELDDTRYRLALQALQARLRSTRKQHEAKVIDLEQVAESDVRAAEAMLGSSLNEVEAARKDVEAAQSSATLARQTLDRERKLLRSGAGTKDALDQAQSSFDTAMARKQQAEAALAGKQGGYLAQKAAVTTAKAAIDLKKAEVQATEQQIEELEQTVEAAKRDVADCKLYAPFPGRITKVLVGKGAIVAAGTPVVTLTLLDPIKVSVAVSADADREIRPSDPVQLFPMDPLLPGKQVRKVLGIVYSKGEVADVATRTFRVDIMVRNERILPEHRDPELAGLPLVKRWLPIVHRHHKEGGDLFVGLECLLRENGKTYVLRLPRMRFGHESNQGERGKHVPEKVEVKLGEGHITIVRWNFRRIANPEAFEEGQVLVSEPTREHLEGVMLGHYSWLIRPGDLVPVSFSLGGDPKGFYVPVEAVRSLNGEAFVFVLDGDRARRVDVTVGGTSSGQRRIEGEGVTEGARLIVRGVHYVADGDRVTVVGEERAR